MEGSTLLCRGPLVAAPAAGADPFRCAYVDPLRALEGGTGRALPSPPADRLPSAPPSKPPSASRRVLPASIPIPIEVAAGPALTAIASLFFAPSAACPPVMPNLAMVRARPDFSNRFLRRTTGCPGTAAAEAARALSLPFPSPAVALAPVSRRGGSPGGIVPPAPAPELAAAVSSLCSRRSAFTSFVSTVFSRISFCRSPRCMAASLASFLRPALTDLSRKSRLRLCWTYSATGSSSPATADTSLSPWMCLR